MNIREELRYAAESENKQMSGMAITIVLWAFCSSTESPADLSKIEMSIFLLLCAEAL